jgi:hypothetical protein
VKLLIGTDNKSIVTEKVGLPNKIKKSDGKEYWLYSGKGTDHGVIIAFPIGVQQVSSGTQIHYLSNEISSSIDVESNIDLVCVFNQKKVLVDAFKPGSKGKK